MTKTCGGGVFEVEGRWSIRVMSPTHSNVVFDVFIETYLLLLIDVLSNFSKLLY